MSVNIACSVISCTNPVIGQCTGYEKTCGRYYCHNHSTDTLCADCGSQKTADEHAELVYQEYLTLAEKVFRKPVPTNKFDFQAKTLFKLSVLSFTIGAILLILLIVTGIIVENITQQISEGMVTLYSLSILGTLVLIGWPFGIIPLAWLAQYQNWVTKERQKTIAESLNKIEKEKPGFTQFWNTWLKQRQQEQEEKNRQALMGVLTVAGVIAAGVIGSALTESEYDRTRRAVRDELNR